MGLQKKIALWGYLFVLPGFLLLLIFRFIPMVTAAYLSLTRYDLFTSPKFVGIKNYLDLAHDQVFLQSVKVSFFYTVGSVVPALILALILAMLTVKAIRFGNILYEIYVKSRNTTLNSTIKNCRYSL